jgi:hypothetical protein
MELTPQFREKGKKLMELHKDFNDALKEASDSGLTISAAAVAEIVRLEAPEVAYYYAQEEHFGEAHNLMGLADDKQVVEVRRKAKELEESGFASDPDTSTWLKERSPAMAKREGRRVK